MFGFKKREVVDAVPAVRKIVDVTIPNKPTPHESRAERRFNRTLPVIVTPWNGSEPVIANAVMAITHDISDYGVGIIATEALDKGQFVVTLWPDQGDFEEPVHLLCELVSTRRFAHGFWTSGFLIREYLNKHHRHSLMDINAVAEKALRYADAGQSTEQN